jgi:hypothetical protein
MNVIEVRDASKTDRPLSEGSTVRLAQGALVKAIYQTVSLRQQVNKGVVSSS